MTALLRERRGEDHGTTLIELVVVLFVMGIVLAVVFGFLTSATSFTTKQSANEQAEQDGVVLMRQLTSDLRSAASISTTYPASGSCPAGGSFSAPAYTGYGSCLGLTILRPGSGLGTTCPRTEVTYGIAAGTLYTDRVEYVLSGSSCVTGRTATKRALSTDIVNDAAHPLFAYYDKSGLDMLAASPARAPKDAASIRVTVQKRYRLREGTVLTFSDVVALRNKR